MTWSGPTVGDKIILRTGLSLFNLAPIGLESAFDWGSTSMPPIEPKSPSEKERAESPCQPSVPSLDLLERSSQSSPSGLKFLQLADLLSPALILPIPKNLEGETCHGSDESSKRSEHSNDWPRPPGDCRDLAGNQLQRKQRWRYQRANSQTEGADADNALPLSVGRGDDGSCKLSGAGNPRA